jgi:hypothetical protein
LAATTRYCPAPIVCAPKVKSTPLASFQPVSATGVPPLL